MLFPFLFALFGCPLLFVHSDDVYPLVLRELYSKPAEARYQFCQQSRFTAVYSTGVYYKAVLREDDTSLLKLGKTISRTKAFIFKFNPYSGSFFDHKVTLEGSDDKLFHDFVAFAGAHIDLFNRTTDLFVEMLRKVQLHTRENEFAFNQVAFTASRILASKHIALDSLLAQNTFWNMCFIGAFNESGCCFQARSGKCAANKLFHKNQVWLSSPEDHYALLFLKQQNTLVLIRSTRMVGASDEHLWKLGYSYVRLTDGVRDVSKQWESADSPEESLDYRVIGAIDYFKRYYLVTVNNQEELQLRKVIDHSKFPLKLDAEPIDFHHFFGCKVIDFSEYYQTMVNAVVVVFCCSSYWVCRKAADYQRRQKPMAKGGDAARRVTTIGRQLRPATGSEKQQIASQYLLRAGGTDNYFVDEKRMQRDERRLFVSIADMAKQMLHATDIEQLKEKIAKKKAAENKRQKGMR